MLGDDDGWSGVLPWSAVLEGKDEPRRPAADAMSPRSALAYPDEILRTIADRMAARAPRRASRRRPRRSPQLVGSVTQFDLLDARQKLLEEERQAERVLTLRRRPADRRAGGDCAVRVDAD